MSESYNIKKETLEKWLISLYQLSDADTLENAVTTAKMIARTEQEIEISRTIAVLFRAECSGEIEPPLEIRSVYSQIVARLKKEED